MERRASARSGLAAQVVLAGVHAAMTVRPFPRPARRSLAVFHRHRALGSHPLHTSALETAAAAGTAAPDVAMETGGSHATVRLPASPAPPAGKPPPQLCLPMLRTDAHVHARTHAQLAADCAVGQAAATASAAQIEHSTSAAQQPTAQVWPLSAGRCARPEHAHAHARPAFDPATAAARP